MLVKHLEFVTPSQSLNLELILKRESLIIPRILTHTAVLQSETCYSKCPLEPAARTSLSNVQMMTHVLRPLLKPMESEFAFYQDP